MRKVEIHAAAAQGDSLSFGAAVELAVAMPLSWLPLISDYTKDAEKPAAATAVSAAVYGLVSCWMYVIGMGAAIFAGESDIAQIILKAGIGVAGLLVIVLSTVTTTFMDAYSAGISSESGSTSVVSAGQSAKAATPSVRTPAGRNQAGDGGRVRIRANYFNIRRPEP